VTLRVAATHCNDALSDGIVLRASEVVRRYPGGAGLGPISIAIAEGQVVSIIGANGCGKTTLIRVTSLVEPIDSGRIEVRGKLCANGGERGAKIGSTRLPRGILGPVLGAVFQNAEPWPHLSVMENVLLPLLRTADCSEVEATQRAEEELSYFGLLKHANAMPVQLSGGTKQRVVLARCLAMRPRLLLLDESTSALDPEWTEKVRERLTALARSGGAVISVSHRLNFVRRTSDWILYLNHGHVVEEGPPTILDNPNTIEMQRFIENA
jgi:polar amino acid transport system ATP-binding protein